MKQRNKEIARLQYPVPLPGGGVIIIMAGAAADKAASTREAKYRQLANSHVFVPVAIAGTWKLEPL